MNLTFCLMVACATGWAQLPHSDVVYSPKTNTVTTMHFGGGNTLESITISGKTHTTIRVAPNGQPKQISNELATVDYTFAGTGSVNVTQTVNGQTKTQKVAMNSQDVLNFRTLYKDAVKVMGDAVDAADKFLEKGGASLIGNLLNTINNGIENPINACFQQALDAAKQTDKSIIPINCLEALVEATKFHDEASLKDDLKGQAADYIFQNYSEWRDGLGDAIFKGLMAIDKQMQADNKKEQQNRLELTKALLNNGISLEDAASIVDTAINSGDVYLPANVKLPGDNNSKDKEKKDAEHGQIVDGKLVNPQTPQDFINYAKTIAKAHGGKLPDAIDVNYYKYFMGMPFSYVLKLNKDKKTYTIDNVLEPTVISYDKELDKPYCGITIWYYSKVGHEHIDIPLEKGHVPQSLPK